MRRATCLPLTSLLLATVAALPAAGAAGDCGLYEAVEPGDTLEILAERCGLPAELLLAGNPQIDPDAPLNAGESLMIAPHPAEPSRDAALPQSSPADDTAAVRFLASASEPGTRGATPPLSARIAGLWREGGGSCNRVDATWEFSAYALRDNDRLCEVVDIVSDGDVTQIAVDCGGPDAPLLRNFTLQSLPGGGMTVTGNQFQTNLARCTPQIATALPLFGDAAQIQGQRNGGRPALPPVRRLIGG